MAKHIILNDYAMIVIHIPHYIRNQRTQKREQNKVTTPKIINH